MLSFRLKILLLAAVLVAVTQVATVCAVLVTASRDVHDQAEESLAIGGAVFDQFMASRAEQLRTTIRVLVSDFAFREAAATHDTETVKSVLVNHGARVGADIGMLLDLDGNVITSSDELRLSPLHLASLVHLADEGHPQSTVCHEDSCYQTITVPLRAPVTVAWVVMGFRIDEHLAQRIKDLSGLEVSFISEEGDFARAISSTRSAIRHRSAGSGTLSTPDENLLVAGNSEYLTLRRPFTPGAEGVVAVLQKSVSEAMEPYHDLRRTMTGLGAVAMLAALLGAIWLSRTVTRPVRTLANAAGRVMKGDYRHPVGLRTKDELGELASSFDAMQQAIADREQHITYQAQHDALTGLPNRLQTMEHLAAELQHARLVNESLSVVILDIDHFRDINSSLGHSAGDRILTLVAQRLRANVDEEHIVARFGADEFALVLPGVDEGGAIALVQSLQKILGAGLSLKEVPISIEVTAGVAQFPTHGVAPDELLRRAAIAKNDAKLGHKKIATYETGREEGHLRQLEIVGDLKRAVSEEQLVLYFQPKLSLPTGRVCGAEALVRWNHPRLGLLPPNEFIPAAEKSGAIMLVTRWVLRKAIEQCRLWLDEGLELSVAINISAQDLLDEYLPYLALDVLREHGVKPGLLTLEVTENAVMRNPHHCISVLACLRDIGVKIAIDDFGTGYSSLAQLQRLPLHELKIDRTFVMKLPEDERNAAIVRTTIDLAHNLKLEVVAEGVETAKGLEWLQAEGCERAQGFHIGKPMMVEEFTDLARGDMQELIGQSAASA